MRIKKVSETTPTMASVINTYSNSTTDTYSCDYINKIGKLLWSGNFTSGEISVPGIHNYMIIIVVLEGNVMCIGSKSYGGGIVGSWGSYNNTTWSYRIATSNDTISINEYDKGGSNGTSQVPITAIYGLI